MPLENRKEVVSLLAEHQIPLFEDDTFGELRHGKDRPRSLKSFDRKGLVLHCSSVSKKKPLTTVCRLSAAFMFPAPSLNRTNPAPVCCRSFLPSTFHLLPHF